MWRKYLGKEVVDERLGKILDKMVSSLLTTRYTSAREVLTQLKQLDTVLTTAPKSDDPMAQAYADSFTKNISPPSGEMVEYVVYLEMTNSPTE